MKIAVAIPLFLVLLVGIRVPAGAQPPTDLAQLVAQLDADQFAIREAATERLLAVGSDALPALATVVHDGSLEAADRAVWILDQLSRGERRDVQLAALEALTSATRFPLAQTRATERLDELQETLCREEFERQGAKFAVQHSVVTVDGIATQVKIELPPAWTGSAATFARLASLRGLHTVEIKGTSLDQPTFDTLAQLPAIKRIVFEGLQVAPQTVWQLKQANANLRVQVKGTSAIGVTFLENGVFAVDRVQPGSPASEADLQPGDVIESVAGNKVESFDLLTAHISQYPPGSDVELQVRRGEATITKHVILASREAVEQGVPR